MFACAGWVYPYLIGNDIGCGMAPYRTDLTHKAVKLDRWERRLVDLDGRWSGDAGAWLADRGVAPTAHDLSLGTIGLGIPLAGGPAFADDGRAACTGLPSEAALRAALVAAVAVGN